MTEVPSEPFVVSLYSLALPVSPVGYSNRLKISL
jgi:hypothetical protein